MSKGQYEEFEVQRYENYAKHPTFTSHRFCYGIWNRSSVDFASGTGSLAVGMGQSDNSRPASNRPVMGQLFLGRQRSELGQTQLSSDARNRQQHPQNPPNADLLGRDNCGYSLFGRRAQTGIRKRKQATRNNRLAIKLNSSPERSALQVKVKAESVNRIQPQKLNFHSATFVIDKLTYNRAFQGDL
jgi:hypothetical protein